MADIKLFIKSVEAVKKAAENTAERQEDYHDRNFYLGKVEAFSEVLEVLQVFVK